MSFTGRYPGECGACGEETKGTEIFFDTDDVLVHVICPDVLPRKAKAVCPRCFLELPATGVCDQCDD